MRSAVGSIFFLGTLCVPLHPADAVLRTFCYAKESANNIGAIIGAYDAPDGQLVGHAVSGSSLGEWVPIPLTPVGYSPTDWIKLSKSSGRLDDGLWYRWGDLRCVSRGGF